MVQVSVEEVDADLAHDDSGEGVCWRYGLGGGMGGFWDILGRIMEGMGVKFW